MHDGEGSVLTTDTEYVLCHECRGKLLARDVELVPEPDPPWPRPAEEHPR
jgi:hypothetical protein